MLFNSYIFIMVFLPITVAGFFLIGRSGRHALSIAWLVCASLFFYGWWNPVYLSIIVGSILFNYYWGIITARGSRYILTLGIAVNLGLLGYFKYANFFVDNLSAITGLHLKLAPIVLPLAISFFTFQQISYLVDTYRGRSEEHSFLNYCLFVTFFPQLIAGPIVHHSEMLPQFGRAETFRFDSQKVAVGITIFFFGLFKKVIIADGMAPYATPVFEAVRLHYGPSFLEAWEGALAYTLQIYYDFSGYSDMAIGLAYLFGIRIPLNFNSPYKSLNIIDFWRRWHISLSRFLRDYLYIPLGGNRKGEARRHVNIMITMLLGGLWHGAAWTFVLWGGLHGMFLVVNHLWLNLKKRYGFQGGAGFAGRLCAGTLTFLSVTVAWVFFRADSASAAGRMLAAMAGQNGFALPEKYLHKFGALAGSLSHMGVDFRYMHYFKGSNEVIYILVALLVAWFAPNVQQIMNSYKPYINIMAKRKTLPDPPTWLAWRPSIGWAAILVACVLTSILMMSRASEFLYFQF
ncbi:MAG: membrane-bound O-acyltransferase family protein [Desulfococcus sp. 4484_241]|nr:MAG: membrane-bound O-acyltransferase family protein [Desulfococcus sp. 4484_241]